MFVNLDQLPPGKHLFTVCVTDQPVGTPADEIGYDEIDVVADHGANAFTVVGSMREEDRRDYAGQRVIGVIDQSASHVLLQDPDSEIRVVL